VEFPTKSGHGVNPTALRRFWVCSPRASSSGPVPPGRLFVLQGQAAAPSLPRLPRRLVTPLV